MNNRDEIKKDQLINSVVSTMRGHGVDGVPYGNGPGYFKSLSIPELEIIYSTLNNHNNGLSSSELRQYELSLRQKAFDYDPDSANQADDSQNWTDYRLAKQSGLY